MSNKIGLDVYGTDGNIILSTACNRLCFLTETDTINAVDVSEVLVRDTVYIWMDRVAVVRIYPYQLP